MCVSEIRVKQILVNQGLGIIRNGIFRQKIVKRI